MSSVVYISVINLTSTWVHWYSTQGRHWCRMTHVLRVSMSTFKVSHQCLGRSFETRSLHELSDFSMWHVLEVIVVYLFLFLAGFPIDAEVEVFTHKQQKMTYKIKMYASMWRTVLCTYFLVLSDRSAVSTSSRRKGKRSSTGIKVFCVVSLDMSMRIAITPFSLFLEHRENCKRAPACFIKAFEVCIKLFASEVASSA